MRLLYLTWDGPETSYLEGLFFPIFERLRAKGVATHVLQLSWDLERFQARTEAAARRHGVGYEVHAVPRRPLQAATGVAILGGAALLARAAARHRAEVVMPRSHIPGAMALAARRWLGEAALVWDSDGLMPDERADFGGWDRGGLQYRAFLAVERALVRRAAGVLTRTARAARLLQDRAGVGPGRFTVVSNGKDPGQFRPATEAERGQVRASLGLGPGVPLLVYAGSLGPQYRPREMARCFALARSRRPDLHFLLLTGAVGQAREVLEAASLPPGSFTVKQVPADEVAAVVRAADAGLSFREPCASMAAVCPIKVAEYLLSGVPVLANAGVGDLDLQLVAPRAARLLPDLSEASLASAAEALVAGLLPDGPASRAAARELGLKHFTLDACAAGYSQALNRALGARHS